MTEQPRTAQHSHRTRCSGTGKWIDAEGHEHRERELVTPASAQTATLGWMAWTTRVPVQGPFDELELPLCLRAGRPEWLIVAGRCPQLPRTFS